MKRKLKSTLVQLAVGGVMLGGGLSFAYGFWLAWPPLGFIVAGLLLAPAAFFFGYGTKGKR